MEGHVLEASLVPITVGVVFAVSAVGIGLAMGVRFLTTEPPSAPDALARVEQAVNEIRSFQKTLVEDGLDDYRACSSREDALAKAAAPAAVREPTRCWSKIGWTPSVPIAGGYWVELVRDGADFEVHGVIDTDADGRVAEFVATSETPAARVSPSGVW